jgi:shikimate dehydrogenase
VTYSPNLVGVIGRPIGHSLSPVLHRAAFASLGLDWNSYAFEVADGQVAAALDGVRALGLRGLSVTMPHKQTVAASVSVLTDVARDLDAVNCVTLLDDGRLEGHNTDGAGFVDALRAESSIELLGACAVVLGAGGAARAVVRALAEAGVAEVCVVNRSVGSARRAADLAGACGRVGGADAITDADLVVQATSVGMGDHQSPCDPALLRPGQVVAELIYHPAETPLMGAARAKGCHVVGGLAMLVHQAVHAIERWTGQRPDPAPMQAAGAAVLSLR